MDNMEMLEEVTREYPDDDIDIKVVKLVGNYSLSLSKARGSKKKIELSFSNTTKKIIDMIKNQSFTIYLDDDIEEGFFEKDIENIDDKSIQKLMDYMIKMRDKFNAKIDFINEKNKVKE